ncbi:MAG TPA: hypothetical protein DIU11_04370, partial [Pusillimonas sp.]|nr:hypothetical protein [Pusillimonas sp.]
GELIRRNGNRSRRDGNSLTQLFIRQLAVKTIIILNRLIILACSRVITLSSQRAAIPIYPDRL